MAASFNATTAKLRSCDLQSWKYLLSGPLWRKLAKPGPETAEAIFCEYTEKLSTEQSNPKEAEPRCGEEDSES